MSDANAIAPTNVVHLDPSDSLTFHLQPTTSPQSVLTIRNTSEARKIAFKVKTTRPMRYLVRPNQGMLGPNMTASIMVILQQKDCDELLRLDPSERQLSNDKFLVQSSYVDDSFYELVKTKSSKEMADELTNMWARADKNSLANKKLRCRFIEEAEPTPAPTPAPMVASTSTISSSAPTVRADHLAERMAVETPLPSGESSPVHVAPVDTAELTDALLENQSHATGDSSMADPAELKKKYSELVRYTVQMTAQRESLIADLKRAQEMLEQVTSENQRIRREESTLRQRRIAGSAATGADDSHTGANRAIAKDATAFTMAQMIICAIVFFLIGRFY